MSVCFLDNEDCYLCAVGTEARRCQKHAKLKYILRAYIKCMEKITLKCPNGDRLARFDGNQIYSITLLEQHNCRTIRTCQWRGSLGH